MKIPLDSGWLTGKYNAESRFNDIRSRWSKHDIETRALLVQKVQSIVGRDKNISQIAIAFCLAYDAVSTVIPGNVNIEQLTSNVKSTEIPISDFLVSKIENLY